MFVVACYSASSSIDIIPYYASSVGKMKNLRTLRSLSLISKTKGEFQEHKAKAESAEVRRNNARLSKPMSVTCLLAELTQKSPTSYL